jgi:hypothetical protein
MIAQLISHHPPSELRFAMVDLKGGLEFGFYEHLPHLYGNIIQEMEEVLAAVQVLVGVMNERFATIKAAGAKKYESYRQKFPELEFPRIICVFDEVASLGINKTVQRDIMALISLLVAKGRAVGMHVWLCTQRPDIEAVPGAVKANLSGRLSFRMVTHNDSFTVLGNGMAKTIPDVQGRAVMQVGPDPIFIQTAHISDEELFDALKVAHAMAPGEPIATTQTEVAIAYGWNRDRMIDYILNHMEPAGLLSARRVHEHIGDPELSRDQVNKLVTPLWDGFDYKGIRYEVKKKGNTKVAVAATSQLPNFPSAPMLEVGQEVTLEVGEVA